MKKKQSKKSANKNSKKRGVKKKSSSLRKRNENKRLSPIIDGRREPTEGRMTCGSGGIMSQGERDYWESFQEDAG